MEYEQYKSVLRWYAVLVTPTEADFKKYSAAFFEWTRSALERAEVKYPSKKHNKHGCELKLNMV